MTAFRGWFALNGVEFANSSRLMAHLGYDIPVDDSVFGGGNPGAYALVEDPPDSGLYIPASPPLGSEDDGLYEPGILLGSGGLYLTENAGCDLIESVEYPGMFEIPDSCVEVSPGLWSPPNGARRFGPGLLEVDGTCWGPAAVCAGCRTVVEYDDSWPGLAEWLGDAAAGPYRPELAPWYSAEIPESAEFGGVLITSVEGLGDPTPVERTITQMAGSGASAGPNRDLPITAKFEATLFACTHAGLVFGKEWLACLLRDATVGTSSTLRYLAASPSHSDADPDSLVREVHGVVETKAPTVLRERNTDPRQNQQATEYIVGWELTALSPYAYLPAVHVPVLWDEVTRQSINWIHGADCTKPEGCEDMPVLFSSECVPEQIPVVNTPPPVCGGCLPVGEIDKYSFQVPTMDYAFRCRETAVTTIIRNTGETPLTLQAFWRECGADVLCEDNLWPLQVSGLAPAAELVLDGVTGDYWAFWNERRRSVVGVVGTPNGAPWRPPIIDRTGCWDFIIQAAASAEFTVELVLADRAP